MRFNARTATPTPFRNHLPHALGAALFLCGLLSEHIRPTPAHASGVIPACQAPDVIYQIAPAHVYVSAFASCGIPFQERVLPTAASDGFNVKEALSINSQYVQGNTQFNFAAVGGHCVIELKTTLSVAANVPVACSPGLGTEVFGSPGLVGLSIYVRGQTGTHYWLRGDRVGTASVTPHPTVRRTAASVCCQAVSGTPPSSCACDPLSYDLQDGIIGTTNAGIDAQLIYQGVEYRRVLRLRIDSGCSGPKGSTAWTAVTSSRYAVDAGLNDASGHVTCSQYDACAWNGLNPPQMQWDNNCYNYATRRHVGPLDTSRFAQIGRGSGDSGIGTPQQQIQRALNDGLVLSDATSPCPAGMCKVALLIAETGSWHWARQDPDGTWSHKPGHTPATNLDCDGQIMTSASQAQFCSAGSPHLDVVAYFCVPTFGVHIAAPRGFLSPEGILVAAGDTLPEPPRTAPYATRTCYPGLNDPFYVLTASDSTEIISRLQGMPPAPDPNWVWHEHFGPVFRYVNLPGPLYVLIRDGIVQITDSTNVSYYYDVTNLSAWADARVPMCGTGLSGTPEGSGETIPQLTVDRNPVHQEARFRFTLRGPGELVVLDATGRLVWRAAVGAVTGQQELVWPLVDIQGRQVGAGVYFARLSAKSAVQYAKLVVVR